MDWPGRLFTRETALHSCLLEGLQTCLTFLARYPHAHNQNCSNSSSNRRFNDHGRMSCLGLRPLESASTRWSCAAPDQKGVGQSFVNSRGTGLTGLQVLQLSVFLMLDLHPIRGGSWLRTTMHNFTCHDQSDQAS